MTPSAITREPGRQRPLGRLRTAVSAWRETVRLAGGVKMDRRMNLTGFRWLKSNYLSTAHLLSTWPRDFTPRDFELLFTALTVQANPAISDADAIEAVRRTGRIRIHLALLLRGGMGHNFT